MKGLERRMRRKRRVEAGHQPAGTGGLVPAGFDQRDAGRFQNPGKAEVVPERVAGEIQDIEFVPAYLPVEAFEGVARIMPLGDQGAAGIGHPDMSRRPDAATARLAEVMQFDAPVVRMQHQTQALQGLALHVQRKGQAAG
jgi:hypothetical protein